MVTKSRDCIQNYMLTYCLNTLAQYLLGLHESPHLSQYFSFQLLLFDSHLVL